MEKNILINSYKNEYENHINLLLSEEQIAEFWQWFEKESRLFDKQAILNSNNEYNNFKSEIIPSACYHNSIIVNQKLNYDYYEGLYSITPKMEVIDMYNPPAYSHGFNVSGGKVNDITFQKTNDGNVAHFYLGVKIDNEFIKEVIKHHNTIENIQFLFGFFLREHGYDDYLDLKYYNIID